ncbi:MAG: 16S rRNA (cytosine(1402)-N(4))-methyltransferase RsmH [Solobacterium sp.]|nr:16S rRNA (cytosine(1402)-N(4))-methyltransferase RsmH [Solobacterium sp.]
MMEHRSVLLEETIDLLAVKPDGIYVDGTLGRAGHAGRLLGKLKSGHLYAFDKDENALKESGEVLASYSDKVTLIHSDFRHMKECLKEYGVEMVDGVMMDLGVSSPQFDDPERGFSYRFDSRLDMRMDRSQRLSAYEVVNEYPFEDLVRILRAYGEEPRAKQIARAIEKRRSSEPIETTGQLTDVIRSALPEAVLRKKGHPAKQTFQAIRIEVNHELDALSEGLKEACDLLAVGGRCAVITFHSLEDRLVKKTFKELSSAPFADPRLPLKESQMEQASFSLVTRHPVTAGETELSENHRAHSAKLRVIERIRKKEDGHGSDD